MTLEKPLTGTAVKFVATEYIISPKKQKEY